VSDHVPTLADVCCAIAEGSIVASLDGTMYRINALELRRYLNRSRPLPTITTAALQVSSQHADPGNWHDTSHTSIA
jgi:hypothetical protein